jgi:malate dehydrogenase (oxaloacetate-decarboxylating)(NADP+)
MADIAIEAAAFARQLGHVPRVALLSHASFGGGLRDKSRRIADGVHELERRQVDFEFDGEMGADVALDFELMRTVYPFCRLSGPANVLVMPGLHTANVSHQIMEKLGGGTVIGPLLAGLAKPAQIVHIGASVGEIVNVGALVAYESQLKR